jgi:LPXTG-site transpeptidase (sortase) family protein
MQGFNAFNLNKIRYYSSVGACYALTLLFAVMAFKPISHTINNSAIASSLPIEVASEQPSKQILTGKPVRIVIPDVGIDLPIDEGRYNEADGSWSLSGYHAQYAMLTPLANDASGNTFIYGHNNKYVFGPIKRINAGSAAQIYTDNNRIFKYTFQSTYAVTPENTSILYYEGPSILTVQTCSGAWNEQRQMYVFKFEKVEGQW